jgi:hypothetical protein
MTPDVMMTRDSPANFLVWVPRSFTNRELLSLIHNQTTGIFRRFDNLREKYLTEDLPRLLM